MPMVRVLPRPDFVATLARKNLSLTDLAREANIPRTTVYAAVNPSKDSRRRGGWRPATAWTLAETFARLVGIDKQEAFDRLFVIAPANAGEMQSEEQESV